MLELDFDPDAQRAAIVDLLAQHHRAEVERAGEIRRIEELCRELQGAANDRAVDAWVDRLHSSVYQDAAHSLAAVGMLAPFVETIFHQSFLGIQRRFHSASEPARIDNRLTVKPPEQWDCHFFWTGSRWNKDLVLGILQMTDDLGLRSKLPSDLKAVLSALFAYRNKMFHCGFEWPQKEREAFATRISTEGWPKAWFPMASSGELPWIFYMSDEFITHCLNFIHEVLDALGLYVAECATAEQEP